jgi:broad specificity polyphosphatase/5'/3'-nucleotidase SurE
LLEDAPRGTVLNLNVPAVPPGEARGLRWATLDRFGLVRVAVAEASERWLQIEYRETGAELDPESDTALLLDGYATITALEGIAEIAFDELADTGIRPEAISAVLTEVPDRPAPSTSSPAGAADTAA